MKSFAGYKNIQLIRPFSRCKMREKKGFGEYLVSDLKSLIMCDWSKYSALYDNAVRLSFEKKCRCCFIARLKRTIFLKCEDK
jgi:hypothetical protein